MVFRATLASWRLGMLSSKSTLSFQKQKLDSVALRQLPVGVEPVSPGRHLLRVWVVFFELYNN